MCKRLAIEYGILEVCKRFYGPGISPPKPHQIHALAGGKEVRKMILRLVKKVVKLQPRAPGNHWHHPKHLASIDNDSMCCRVECFSFDSVL